MAIPTTRITGKVILPDGTGAKGGTLDIKLSQDGATVKDGTIDHVLNGRKKVSIAPADGSVDFYLVPNDAVSPAGTHWVVTFTLPDGTVWTERWQLATAPNPVEIGDIPRVSGSVAAGADIVLTAVTTVPSGSIADPADRDKVRILHGSTGFPDRIIAAVKNADGTYSWTDLGGGI